MIVFDTNVLSEILRPAPVGGAQPANSFFTAAMTEGEILYGIKVLAEGQRRRKLWEAATAIFREDLAGRVLSFHSDEATLWFPSKVVCVTQDAIAQADCAQDRARKAEEIGLSRCSELVGGTGIEPVAPAV